MYNYIRDFLRDRSITLTLGPYELSIQQPPNWGKPQGSILSSTLFNLAMKDLPKMLARIRGIKHAIYADDLTIWTKEGSPAEIEQALQEAADATARYATRGGLSCSPEKSEFLVVTKHTAHQKQEERHITIKGRRIPQRSHIRVLGITIQSNAKATMTIRKLLDQGTQVIHMLRRIASQHRRMLRGRPCTT